jgi:hypothetical protein
MWMLLWKSLMLHDTLEKRIKYWKIDNIASCQIVYVNATWYSKKCVDGTLKNSWNVYVNVTWYYRKNK